LEPALFRCARPFPSFECLFNPAGNLIAMSLPHNSYSSQAPDPLVTAPAPVVGVAGIYPSEKADSPSLGPMDSDATEEKEFKEGGYGW